MQGVDQRQHSFRKVASWKAPFSTTGGEIVVGHAGDMPISKTFGYVRVSGQVPFFIHRSGLPGTRLPSLKVSVADKVHFQVGDFAGLRRAP